MVRPLKEYFASVHAADVHDYGVGFTVEDYLFGPDQELVDFTITNPPFRLAMEFISRAIRTSRLGCAVLVRSAFLEGAGRYEALFAENPPSYVLQFVERLPMFRGRYNPKGRSATSYCWLIWTAEPRPAPEVHWIAPCRKRLEKPEDVLLLED